MKQLFIIMSLFIGVATVVAQPNSAQMTTEIKGLEVELRQASHDSIKARLALELAHALAFSDMTKASDYANLSITYAKSTKNATLIVKTYLSKCSLLQRQRKSEDALQLLNEGLPYLKNNTDFTQEGIYFGMIAQISFQKGNYEYALANYQKSLIAFEKQPTNKDYEAMTLFQIGNIYQRIDDKFQALQYFQQAATLWEKIENWQRLEGCYRNIGNVYSILGDEPKANQAYEKSIAYGKLTKKRASPTIDQQKEQLERLKNSNNNSLIANSTFTIGAMLLEQGYLQEAIDSLLAALSLATFVDANSLIGDIYFRLANAYHLQGNAELALQYRDRQLAMNRYLLNIERLAAISELEIKYQTAKKEKLLTAAENENLRKSRWIGFLLAGLLIAFLSVLYIQQKRQTDTLKSRQVIEKLEQQKEFEQLQAFFNGEENERKRIATDLHDSLGGLLYALQLQLTYANQPKPKAIIKQAIQENRRIIKNLLPATLIKLGLYDALQEWVIEFQENWNIEVVVKMDYSERVSENIEISAFRIIQELFHNAAKHAEATIIHINLKNDKNRLTFSVQDDGKGMDLKNVSPTFLKTVVSRVSLLEGEYNVVSSLGKGTVVRVALGI